MKAFYCEYQDIKTKDITLIFTDKEAESLENKTRELLVSSRHYENYGRTNFYLIYDNFESVKVEYNQEKDSYNIYINQKVLDELRSLKNNNYEKKLKRTYTIEMGEFKLRLILVKEMGISKIIGIRNQFNQIWY